MFTDTSTDADDAVYFKYGGYALAAITVCILLFTLLMFKRIRIAVACIKVASQAVGTTHVGSLPRRQPSSRHADAVSASSGSWRRFMNGPRAAAASPTASVLGL